MTQRNVFVVGVIDESTLFSLEGEQAPFVGCLEVRALHVMARESPRVARVGTCCQYVPDVCEDAQSIYCRHF